MSSRPSMSTQFARNSRCLRFPQLKQYIGISRVSIDGEPRSSRMAIRSRFHAPESGFMARTGVDPAMMAEAHFPGWNICPMTDTVWIIIIIIYIFCFLVLFYFFIIFFLLLRAWCWVENKKRPKRLNNLHLTPDTGKFTDISVFAWWVQLLYVLATYFYLIYCFFHYLNHY